MTTRALHETNGGTAEMEDNETRPVKRAKPEVCRAEAEGATDEDMIPPHPLGVKPAGNAYASETGDTLRIHMGLFASLPDELILYLLEGLDAAKLLALGGTCKALFAFTKVDDLWRSLFVEASPKHFKWRRSWRSTLLNLPSDLEPHVSCNGLYSDVLYQPFFCAHTPLKKYTSTIPRRNDIPRLDNLSQEAFSTKWSDKPFILTTPVTEWPIYRKWTTGSLLETYPGVICRAEAVDWPLTTYVHYMHNNADESPLYLFDSAFAEKMNIQVGKEIENAAYWAPDCFGEDLFSVLGDQRPDSRWMILGPARSGSTFHKDPNATSAWNAVLTGSKYWLMFPSAADIPPPPGVILSEDSAEITSPLSIAEYLLSFHEMARATPGCKEGICYAGEVVHVPSGWFHLVLNLEESLALTQNFVPRTKLADVIYFLQHSPDQISGFRDEVEDAYTLFVERLREKHPDLLEVALRQLETRTKGSRTRWEELTGPSNEDDEHGTTGGFSFGFGGDDEDDEDDFDIP